jgi:hypothetical protein
MVHYRAYKSQFFNSILRQKNSVDSFQFCSFQVHCMFALSCTYITQLVISTIRGQYVFSNHPTTDVFLKDNISAGTSHGNGSLRNGCIILRCDRPLARVSCRCVESKIESASPLLHPLLHMFRTHSPFTNIQQLGNL